MVLTDGTHLVSTTSLEELHVFAKSVGLKPFWFQPHSKHPHYDITSKAMRKTVLQRGAKLVDTRQLIRRMVRE